MKFLRGLVIVFGLACLWGLGVTILLYFLGSILSIFPAIAIIGLLIGIAVISLRVEESERQKILNRIRGQRPVPHEFRDNPIPKE